MTVSLRTKLLLTSAATVAAVLAIVGVALWRSLFDNELNQLDARLCMEARRVSEMASLQPDSRHLQDDIANKLGLQSNDQLLIRLAQNAPQSELQTMGQWHEIAPSPAAMNCQVTTWQMGTGTWHAAKVKHHDQTGLVGADVSAVTNNLRSSLSKSLGVVVPLAAILALLSGWSLSAMMMRPINRLRESMRQLESKDLGQRIEATNEGREFNELIDAYNAMLERLDHSFHQASRFSADAAHELKTPLTVIQGRIEQAIKRSEGRAIQDELTKMLAQVNWLTGITRKLLMLSQADAGKMALNRSRVDVSTMLTDMVADAHMLLTEQELISEIEPHLIVQADALLLQQLLNNLISNAVRHGLVDGWIRVSAQTSQTHVCITVSNQCERLPPDQRAFIFQRFFRSTNTLDRHLEGSGLGLSLAREIARAHGGDLELAPSDERIACFTLRLPI